MRIYVVQNFDGTEQLIRAKSVSAALAYARAQVVVAATLASQDDLIALTEKGVKVTEAV